MNPFISILIALVTTPIYFGWFLPIVIIGVFEIIWAFFTIMIPLLLLFKFYFWSTAKTTNAIAKAKVKIRSLELEELAAELMQNLAAESNATACACLGGNGARKHVVIHVRAGSETWSYAQSGKSELAALNKLREHRSHLTGKPAAMRCLSDCPIASRCPNRTDCKEFREIFRRHQLAGSSYAA